ncbi:MAG: cytochrome c oxidase assembly protein [Pseudomonadales bacterium]|nr:cytochrome c oxidase assembly protein [Pseudomonadales bacterium]
MKSTRKLILLISLIPVLMFGFAFAMVPLYGLYCEAAGINQLKAAEKVAPPSKEEQTIANGRQIKVEFDATLHSSLDAVVSEFRSLTPSIILKLGEVHTINYIVKNKSSRSIVTQAVPSITPWWGTEHFKKIECFCFQQQTLAPGEEKKMGLQFYVHSDIPEDIKTLTLSYTLMAVSNVTQSVGL